LTDSPSNNGIGLALQQALDAMSDIYVVYDSSWRFVFQNRAQREAMMRAGLDPDDAMGKVLWDVCHFSPAPRVKQALARRWPNASSPSGKRLERCTCLGDPEKVEQILLNLLSNAIKFTDRGGRVSVGIDCDQHFAEVKVEDTGMGISEDKPGDGSTFTLRLPRVIATHSPKSNS
jgi:signal transduction histidine kinase